MLDPLPEVEPPPLDTLTVKIKSIRIPEDITTRFVVNVTFCDQIILSGAMRSTPARSTVKDKTVLVGSMQYDPSDYEKMTYFPSNPLCVQIYPMKQGSPKHSSTSTSSVSKGSKESKGSQSSPKRMVSVQERNLEDISCCNIDILSLFIDEDKIRTKKRMQPLIKPSILFCKSWDNLPLLSLKIHVTRNPLNELHHNVLKHANWMQLTLIGAYNMLIPHSDEYVYTAASRMPLYNGTEFGLVTFSNGHKLSRNFSSLNFNPKWETLRVGDRSFSHGDAKFERSIDEIQNDDEIPLKSYLDNSIYSTIWGSFHRTLILEDAETLLWKSFRRYQWPLEVHIYGETRGFSFMAFLNLFKLLYPGEDTVRIAVPLMWVNSETMQQTCGCDLLLTPNDKASSVHTTKTVKTDVVLPSNQSPDSVSFVRNTGSDDNNAFVLVEIRLARPLKKAVIPPYIPPNEINEMLEKIEKEGINKRECTGRGQQDRDWQTTMKNAASALRKVPYYGNTEFCQFNRQLSETRTRVELTTSCWQDAAIYINNNFVVENFLGSDEAFEEMLMMGHACLIKSACVMLLGVDNRNDLDPTLRAARHARQMQDISHATELYLQVVVQKPRDANCWRELSTCLKDVDRDWAKVAINKSVMLDPRQHLSLLSKGSMLFEEDSDLAEPFFVALLALYPFWSLGWVITNAYYIQRELFHMADQILENNSKSLNISKTQTLDFPQTWESELGDWWDFSPILPGMSPYYNAADLLLRLRCIKLAEVCVSLALCEGGETAIYYHLVALCCRLQGNIQDALCHCQAGIEKYGEISFLKSLEAECYHKLNDVTAAKAAFEKAGPCAGGYSILLSTPGREQQYIRTILVDLSRRQPSAYVWMALAEDWMSTSQLFESQPKAATETAETETSGPSALAAAKTSAEMCAIQALKWDRRASKAWVLLSKLVKPSARRLHCMQMAWECGYRSTSEQRMETTTESKQSLCYNLGKALIECNCSMCEKTKM